MEGQNGIEMLTGTVEHIVYANEENGYTVCDLGCEDDNGLVTICGVLPYIGEGDCLTVYGNWIHSPKYGRQFKIERFEKKMPADSSAILRYLSARSVKGIGPKTAKKIVDEFGEDTLEVLENHPDWLSQIQGITLKKALEIGEDYRKKSGIRNAMMFFREFFGPATIVKIYNKWGGASIDTVKKNPYILCNEIEGIGFERVDAMAQQMACDIRSEDRIRSALTFFLSKNAVQNGHVCLPREKLASGTAQMIGCAEEDVDKEVAPLLASQKIRYSVFNGERYMYAAYQYESEQYIAEKLILLDKTCPKVDTGDIDAFIRKEEVQSHLSYAPAQRRAIAEALENGVMILTGGPGTGKTTVVKALIDIFEGLGMKAVLSAPTGRAAKRMSEATSHEAKTIHRLLEPDFGDSKESGERVVRFRRNETDLLDEDVVIVDEASMIDNCLMASLLKAVKPGARVIIIGDADQLPSVGAGYVLHDLIESRRFATVQLEEIFRQAQRSLIVTNAHKINVGEMPLLDVKDNDFFFLPRESDAEIAQTIVALYQVRLPKRYGAETEGGIQVISPSRKGEAGTETLNLMLQAALNPPSKHKRERRFRDVTFREGDRVMQTKNDYELEWEKDDGSRGTGIFNGDIGVIEKIIPSEEKMTVIFDDRRAEYDFSVLEELEHAYAVTVHKSQGSEYPFVIIPMYSAPYMLLTRNLLYTAVTRAQKMVILVGKRSVVETMVANYRHSMRYTGLAYRLTEHQQSAPEVPF